MGNGRWMPCMVLGGKYDELIKPRWWSGAAAPDQGDDSGKANHTRSEGRHRKGMANQGRQNCRSARGPRNAATDEMLGRHRRRTRRCLQQWRTAQDGREQWKPAAWRHLLSVALCSNFFFLSDKSQTWHNRTGQTTKELPHAFFWFSDVDLHISNPRRFLLCILQSRKKSVVLCRPD